VGTTGLDGVSGFTGANWYTIHVTLPQAIADGNYALTFTPEGPLAKAPYISSKDASGFTMHVLDPNGSPISIEWTATPYSSAQ
jgi:hypothetical protein